MKNEVQVLVGKNEKVSVPASEKVHLPNGQVKTLTKIPPFKQLLVFKIYGPLAHLFRALSYDEAEFVTTETTRCPYCGSNKCFQYALTTDGCVETRLSDEYDYHTLRRNYMLFTLTENDYIVSRHICAKFMTEEFTFLSIRNWKDSSLEGHCANCNSPAKRQVELPARDFFKKLTPDAFGFKMRTKLYGNPIAKMTDTLGIARKPESPTSMKVFFCRQCKWCYNKQHNIRWKIPKGRKTRLENGKEVILEKSFQMPRGKVT